MQIVKHGHCRVPTRWAPLSRGASAQDASLRHTIQFGIGLHHAGLVEGDRDVVEALFVAGRIQVLVATSTLAWGVNTPAHLVIIKGTEFFDAPTRSATPRPVRALIHRHRLNQALTPAHCKVAARLFI